MRFLTYWQNACKFAHLTCPSNQASVFGLDYLHARSYGCKFSGNSKLYKNKKIGKHLKRRMSKQKNGSISKRRFSNSKSSITPVALISTANQRQKFALIPVNLFQSKRNDEEAFKDALAILSLLRDNGRQIELFADNWANITTVEEKDARTMDNHTDTGLENSTLTEFEGPDESFWAKGQNPSTEGNIKDNKKEKALEIPSVSFSTTGADKKESIAHRLPAKIEDELKKIPVSGMQLNFEMDMTNVKDALFNYRKLSKKPSKQRKLRDSNLALSTDVRIGSSDANTIPLHFNALIKGTVDVNPNEFPEDRLNNLKVPEFNEHITAIAANLCSTALQKGFPTDVCARLYSSENSKSKSVKTVEDPPQNTNPKVDENTYSSKDILTLFKRYDKLKTELDEPSEPRAEKSTNQPSEELLRVAATVPIDPKEKKKNFKEKMSPHIALPNKGCSSPGLADNASNVPEKTEQSEAGGKLGLLDCDLYRKSCSEAFLKRKELGASKDQSKELSSKSNLKKSSTSSKSVEATPKGPAKNPCQKQSIASLCGNKKVDVRNHCKKSSATSKCGCAKNAGSKNSCQKPPIDSTCGPKKTDEKDPCKKSSATLRHGSKKTCKKPSLTSKCGSKKPSTNKLCKKASNSSKCGSNKSCKGLSKCGSGKVSIEKPTVSTQNACKRADNFKGGIEHNDPCKKSSKPVEATPKSPAKNPCQKQSIASICGNKKVDANSKCGSTENADSKNVCQKPSIDSTCGPKEIGGKDPCKKSSATAKHGSKKTETKDPCKKSSAISTCGAKKTDAKNPSKKSPATVKCGSKKADPKIPSTTSSTCGSKKTDAKDPCKKSLTPTKCGSKTADTKNPCHKTSTISTCGSKNVDAKTTCEKSFVNSKCGSKKTEPKDPCRKDDPKDSCKQPSTTSKCGSKKPSTNNLCKKSSISSKCGSNKSGSKNPCKELSKCGSGKGSIDTSTSKCGSKKPSTNNLCKKSSISSKCGSNKSGSKKPCNELSKCGSGKGSIEKPTVSTQNACMRAEKSKNVFEHTDPCKKSSSASSSGPKESKVSKPKSNCGNPPRGDIKPRCKALPKSSGKKTPPIASGSKENKSNDSSKSKREAPAKCSKEGCPVCSSKSKLHTLAAIESPIAVKAGNYILERPFSDECPREPKSYSSSEYLSKSYERRRSCENLSWKDTNIHRKKRKDEPKKSCYETIELCPDTACYNIFIKKQKTKEIENTNEKGKKLCKIQGATKSFCTLLTPKSRYVNQRCHNSSSARVNEEALIAAPYKLCAKQRSVPKILESEVLLKVDSVALSDSDIFMFETGGKKYKTTLGNEAAGVVEKVGKKVMHLKVGDHVAIEAGVPCGNCHLCKTGYYNLCQKMIFKGCLRKYCAHPAAFCHKICECVPFEHAALVYQLGLGCNACYRANIKSNSNVVVIGSCGMSVCAAMCAKVIGAEKICVLCDIQETQDIVKDFVTHQAHCFNSTKKEIELVKMILDSLGTRPDVVINCSGCTKTMNAAIMALRPSGKCVLCGLSSECASFNIIDALTKEISIEPSFRSKNMFPVAISLLESGRVPIDCVLANCCKWDQLESAFQTALSEANNGPRKVVVQCHGTSDHSQRKNKTK